MDQFFIALFGVSAIWLTQQPRDHLKKWASVLGLISQPFWFYASFTEEQWGIFILSFFYTAAWGMGFKHHWLAGATEQRGSTWTISIDKLKAIANSIRLKFRS